MSQPDELTVPTKIPYDLWNEINSLKAALAIFAYNARMSAHTKELLTRCV
jgi:hypothetical protein